MKSKKGKTSALIVLGILSIIGLLGFLVYNQTTQSVVQEQREDTPSGCADSTGVLTVNDRSASSYGTTPGSPTITCGVDGGAVTTSVTSGTTTFAVGSSLECLLAISDYIDESFAFTMPCGGKQLDAPLWYSTSDNPAITWYNTDDNAVTNAIAGSTVNQSSVTAGSTFTMNMKLQGSSGESTGEGLLVIEFPASTSGNITTATLGGKQPLEGVPSVYSSANAGSKVFAFDVGAVEEGLDVKIPLQVQLTASKDLTGGVNTTWYAKQKFVDDDKTIKIGIQDSDGTAQYENLISSAFYIE